MARQYKSEALAAVHETALGLTEAGVMTKRTMKTFDELCLTPVKDLSPTEIRAIRLREQAQSRLLPSFSSSAAVPVRARGYHHFPVKLGARI